MAAGEASHNEVEQQDGEERAAVDGEEQLDITAVADEDDSQDWMGTEAEQQEVDDEEQDEGATDGVSGEQQDGDAIIGSTSD